MRRYSVLIIGIVFLSIFFNVDASADNISIQRRNPTIANNTKSPNARHVNASTNNAVIQRRNPTITNNKKSPNANKVSNPDLQDMYSMDKYYNGSPNMHFITFKQGQKLLDEIDIAQENERNALLNRHNIPVPIDSDDMKRLQRVYYLKNTFYVGGSIGGVYQVINMGFKAIKNGTIANLAPQGFFEARLGFQKRMKNHHTTYLFQVEAVYKHLFGQLPSSPIIGSLSSGATGTISFNTTSLIPLFNLVNNAVVASNMAALSISPTLMVGARIRPGIMVGHDVSVHLNIGAFASLIQGSWLNLDPSLTNVNGFIPLPINTYVPGLEIGIGIDWAIGRYSKVRMDIIYMHMISLKGNFEKLLEKDVTLPVYNQNIPEKMLITNAGGGGMSANIIMISLGLDIYPWKF